MRLLITGGSGDLGLELCKQATAWGYDVLTTYLSRRGRVKYVGADHAIRVDLSEPGILRQILFTFKPEMIIHTATVQGTPDTYQKVTAMGYNLLQLSSPTTRLINISTDMVFDGTHAPYGDDAPPGPQMLSDYARGKAEVERMMLESDRTLTIRSSLIYDFNRANKQSAWMLNKIEANEKVKLFYDEFRSPIWLENLAEAVIELAEGDAHGIINVAGPESMSRVDLGRGLLDVLKYDPDQHIEAVSQAGSGRAPDLTLDVRRAKSMLTTRLLSFDEARESAKV